MSVLQTTHQSLIFRDQLWASSFATLDFKKPLHQIGEVFHYFLQCWPRLVGWQTYLGDIPGTKLVKTDQVLCGSPKTQFSFDLTFASRNSTYAILEYVDGLVGAVLFARLGKSVRVLQAVRQPHQLILS